MTVRRIDITAAPYNADSTGAVTSTAALTAAITYANANRPCVIYMPLGGYLIDDYCGTLLAGVSIEGDYAGPGIVATIDGDESYAYVGTTIIIPAGPNQAKPWCRWRRGAGFSNLNFRQPDQTAEGITTGWIDGDPKNGYWVEGAPEVYAPIFVPDMTHDDNGGAAHINGGRVSFSRIGLIGVYDGFHLRDDAAANQKAVADIEIHGVRGWCLHDSFVFGQVSVMSNVDDVRLTPAFFSVAGQDIGDLSDPFDPTSARVNPQRFCRWAKRNATGIKLTNRAVGMKVTDFGLRCAQQAYWLIGGYQAEGDPYRGLRSGRVNQGHFDWGGEQVATAVRISADAYNHEIKWTLGGHAVDDEDPTCVTPVFRIDTDRDIAGNLSHATDEDGNRIFKTQGEVLGWRFEVHSNIRESSGPLLVSGAADGHCLVKWIGIDSRVCQGDPTRAWFEIAAGSRLKLKHVISECYPSANGSRNIYSVPDKAHLRCVGNDYFGIARLTNIDGLDLRDTSVFVGCEVDQRGFSALAEPDMDGAVNIVALVTPAVPADADLGTPGSPAGSGAVRSGAGGADGTGVEGAEVLAGDPDATQAAFYDKYD